MIPTLTTADHQRLQHLEESLWREATRFDPVYMDRVLAEDFWEIGRSGRVYNRDQILASPRGPIDAVLPLPDFQVRSLATDLVQVTYTSKVTYGDMVEWGRRSSIWSRTAGSWVLRFHQGTPYPAPR
jgi:hypothetical protein